MGYERKRKKQFISREMIIVLSCRRQSRSKVVAWSGSWVERRDCNDRGRQPHRKEKETKNKTGSSGKKPSWVGGISLGRLILRLRHAAFNNHPVYFLSLSSSRRSSLVGPNDTRRVPDSLTPDPFFNIQMMAKISRAPLNHWFNTHSILVKQKTLLPMLFANLMCVAIN